MVAPITQVTRAEFLPHTVDEKSGRIQIQTSYYTALVFAKTIVRLEVLGESEAMREARRSIYGGADRDWNGPQLNSYQISRAYPNEVYAVLSEMTRMNGLQAPQPPHPKYGYRVTDDEGNVLPYNEKRTDVERDPLRALVRRFSQEEQEYLSKLIESFPSDNSVEKYTKTSLAVSLLVLGGIGLFVYRNRASSIETLKQFWNSRYIYRSYI